MHFEYNIKKELTENQFQKYTPLICKLDYIIGKN